MFSVSSQRSWLWPGCFVSAQLPWQLVGQSELGCLPQISEWGNWPRESSFMRLFSYVGQQNLPKNRSTPSPRELGEKLMEQPA